MFDNEPTHEIDYASSFYLYQILEDIVTTIGLLYDVWLLTNQCSEG